MNLLRRQRRREIVRLALHVGAAETDKLSRYLRAWYWHKSLAAKDDPVWAVIDAARQMGRPGFTEAGAHEIIASSRLGNPLSNADDLGMYLHLSDATRTELRIRRIGAYDVTKRERTRRRRLQNNEAKKQRRLEQGAQPREQYEAQSLSRTKPWDREGISRRTWYRRRSLDALFRPGRQKSVPEYFCDDCSAPSREADHGLTERWISACCS